jgi:hypothetical protein
MFVSLKKANKMQKEALMNISNIVKPGVNFKVRKAVVGAMYLHRLHIEMRVAQIVASLHMHVQ